MVKKTETFDAQLEKLQDIVTRLEEGDVPLEKGMELFKEGIHLARDCRKKLENAKHEVEVLMQEKWQEFESIQDEGTDNE